MLNILCPIHKQEGFILPFVLFAVIIIMLAVTGGIHIYQNNIRLTDQHIQQLKIESSFQSGISLFKKDLIEGDILPPRTSDESTTKYKVPDGDVTIIYRLAKEEEITEMDEPVYHLRCRITVEDASYSFIHYVPDSFDKNKNSQTGQNDYTDINKNIYDIHLH